MGPGGKGLQVRSPHGMKRCWYDLVEQDQPKDPVLHSDASIRRPAPHLLKRPAPHLLKKPAPNLLKDQHPTPAASARPRAPRSASSSLLSLARSSCPCSAASSSLHLPLSAASLLRSSSASRPSAQYTVSTSTNACGQPGGARGHGW